MTNLFTSPTRSLRHLLVAASVMTLAACATATPYQAASEPGAYDGFSEQFIENDRARISFGGNSLTDRETVENYLLYRSAETAIERGYETFTLQEQNLDEDRKIRVSSTGFNNDPFFRYSFFHQGFGGPAAFHFRVSEDFAVAEASDGAGLAAAPLVLEVEASEATPSLMILMFERSRNIAQRPKLNLAAIFHPKMSIHIMQERFWTISLQQSHSLSQMRARLAQSKNLKSHPTRVAFLLALSLFG